MAKINRFNGNLKAFASNATGSNRTVYEDTLQSDELDDNVNADFLVGWELTNVNEAPTKQDFNALGFTTTQLIAYLHQVGVAEYNALQEYNAGSFANVDGVLYVSQADANIGNDPISDNVNWSSLNDLFAFKNGDNAQKFKVADAVNADEALNKGQLLAAIKQVDGAGSGLDADLLRGLSADFTSSKSTNGYQKLPSGLIIQWGTDGLQSQRHNSQKTLTFPISFPNSVIKILIDSNDPSILPSSVAQVNVLSYTLTSMNTRWSSQTGVTITAERVYIAIGY